MQNMDTATYSFKFSGVKFDIDIDRSFSELERRRLAGERENRKEVHYHAKHEIFFVPDGPFSICTGNSVLDYRDSVVFIPAFCKHYSSRADDYRILFFYEHLGAKRTDFALFIEELFSSCEPTSISSCSELSAYLSELRRLLSSNCDEQSELVASLFKLMLYRIYSSGKRTESAACKRVGESYVIIIERCINNYTADVTLTSVAQELHLSTKQTSRVINKIFKKPLSALVCEKRLSVAADLLLNTELSISEIVARVNFRSENYFYLCFKRAFGITPLSYRKKKTV